MQSNRTCSVDGCEKCRHGGSLCSMHSERRRRTGSLELHRPTAEVRFWSKVQVTGFCWEWVGAISDTGYGSFHISKEQGRTGAHRYVWELLMGPIPDGLVVDHLCRNRSCVNPDHLEPILEAENIRRGMSSAHISRRTNTCRRGHSLADAYLAHRADGRTTRRCRTCQVERAQNTEAG